MRILIRHWFVHHCFLPLFFVELIDNFGTDVVPLLTIGSAVEIHVMVGWCTDIAKSVIVGE